MLVQGLEEEMVATIALDVLKGLEYMHAHSMLHRDVKVCLLPLVGVSLWCVASAVLAVSSICCEGSRLSLH